jgi:hypothetical protein
MRHVSIGFLPEGFHPLHRFLSLSNRQERPAANSIVCSKRVRSSGTAYRAKTVSSDSTRLSEVMQGGRNGRWWHGAAAVVPGQGAREPLELRSCDRSRNSLAKAAGL